MAAGHFIYNNSILDELLTKITPETETKQRVISIFGGVAQLGEHLPCKQGVESSNLFISTQDFPNARTKDADIGGSLLPNIEADVDAYEDSRDRGTCSEGSGKTA